jgi:hypothetical protein
MRRPTVPKTFSVFEVATDIGGRVLPVVIFDRPDEEPQPMMELTAFKYQMLRHGAPLPRLRSIANTMGLLHDFLLLHESQRVLTAESLPSFVLRFFVARCAGTVGADGTDPSGLFWGGAKYDTYKVDRQNIRMYSQYCVKNFGYIPLTTSAISTDYFANQKIDASMRAHLRKSKAEFFAHLQHYREERRPIGPSLSRRPAPSRTGVSDNRSFIPDDELRNIILKTKSVVQRMVFVAGAFGGPRISEQLNMWREDVLPGSYRPILFPDDRASDVPLIVLAHPYAAQYLGRMSIDGASRAQHLMEFYARCPRPGLEDSGRAGWKGMLMDNEQLQLSQVFWISEYWADYYYQLSLELKEEILPRVPRSVLASHPYLLINDDPKGEFFGLPLKLSNLAKAWERACRRIGQEPYRGAFHLHGLRATYVRCLRRCPGIDAEHRQRFLHHINIDSQSAYGNDPAILHDRLRLFELSNQNILGAP